MLEVSSLTPDWTRNWTAKEAEYELHGFKFTGPGWYFSKGENGSLDSMLVVPCNSVAEDVFASEHSEDTIFKFCVYNNRNPATDLQAIANAPVRQDER